MNSRHSRVTDWGLSQVSIKPHEVILDVGCGGGRTVSKLAAMVTQGKVYGLDHSPESVAVAGRINREWIDRARVEIREGSVSQLPFSPDVFGLAPEVEPHFCRPVCPSDWGGVLRARSPGGRLTIPAKI